MNDSPIPKILYVDDEIDNLKIFQMTFNAYYDVYIANSAEEGMASIEKEDFNVVISDERMPKTTGVEFLTAVKEKSPNISRIILTAYSDMQSVIAAINKGRIYHYVTKPWDEDMFKIVIDNAYEKNQLYIENQRLIHSLKSAKKKIQNHNRRLEDEVRDRIAEILDQQKKIQEVRQNVIELELQGAKKNKEELQSEIEKINKKLTTFSLQKIQKNNLLTELKEELGQIMDMVDNSHSRKIQQTIRFVVNTINTERDWEDFKVYFENVHSNFYKTLKQNYRNLTPNEIHLSALLRLNMNIKQASNILGIAPDSVKMARYRLRRKMGLKSKDNLVKFLMNLS